MNGIRRRISRIAWLSLASAGAFLLVLLFFGNWLGVLLKMGGVWAILAMVLVLAAPVAAFLVVDSQLRRPPPEEGDSSSKEQIP